MSKTIKVNMPLDVEGKKTEVKEYTIDDLSENVTSTNYVREESSLGKFMYTCYDTFTRESLPNIFVAPPCFGGALYDTGIPVEEIEPLKEERAAEIAAEEEARRIKEEEERKAAEEEAKRMQEEMEAQMAADLAASEQANEDIEASESPEETTEVTEDTDEVAEKDTDEVAE